MKLEWGRKVACPGCAIPFYDMQKTSLTCPACGGKFESNELRIRKGSDVSMDEAVVDDKISEIPSFEFVDDETSDLSDGSSEIVPEEIEDIKLIDGE
jgi:hypothetical protein